MSRYSHSLIGITRSEDVETLTRVLRNFGDALPGAVSFAAPLGSAPTGPATHFAMHAIVRGVPLDPGEPDLLGLLAAGPNAIAAMVDLDAALGLGAGEGRPRLEAAWNELVWSARPVEVLRDLAHLVAILDGPGEGGVDVLTAEVRGRFPAGALSRVAPLNV
ncbi:hypothetical protein SAMN05444336_101251 [Albimonas donghaensis]|uniref:Uncharacterized protein n=1 Tax=Albimonas donghaensis TaxID=356660 RepID=A0A1H2R6J9_9RHOB|nr:hypothetical protein [Albimonas donghaensis]SDW14991.1 hypothetical protein SAMN05444336_101251 [Albimonas donghaensis]